MTKGRSGSLPLWLHRWDHVARSFDRDECEIRVVSDSIVCRVSCHLIVDVPWRPVRKLVPVVRLCDCGRPVLATRERDTRVRL